MNNIEYEVLFYPINKDDFRTLLKKNGAKLVHPERLLRKAIIDHRFNPQFKCHFLRIRDEGDKVTLSAKTHASANGQIQDKKETEVIVSDFQSTIDILRSAGLNPDQHLESYRETWSFGDAEIVIDTWPGLEPHVEIESNSEQLVKEVSDQLGFDWSKRILHSRVEIYGKLYGLTNGQVLDKFKILTFAANPFANLPVVGTI